MENLQIEIEYVFKLVLFCGACFGYYFFLKNGLNILTERQKQDRHEIEELKNCSEKMKENYIKICTNLTRLESCVQSIKRELDKKCLNTSKNQ